MFYLGGFLLKKWNIEGYFLNVLMIQAWLPNKTLNFNHVTWSLSVELLFYISFPLIFGVFIILLSINNGLITKMFKKPLFVFLGEISYGVYIYAISSLFIN